jgi:DNA invertase Pin-like site-specific DNA recombinase
MKYAFAYIRVSGKGQLEGDGPERQREQIRAFMDANGFTPMGSEFFEQGVSGTVDGVDRPAFLRFIQWVEEFQQAWKEKQTAPGYVDFGSRDLHMNTPALVVERMDRLARDLMVQETLLSECRKRGIKVYAADQGVAIDIANDNGDPSRTLIRQIFGAIAQWEKAVLVNKMRVAREKIRKTGKRCEGVKPYGMLPGEEGILSILRDMVRMKESYAQISRSLNKMGYRTRHGSLWTRKAVQKIASREVI